MYLVCHKSEIKNPVYFYPGAFHFILLCSVLAPSDSSSIVVKCMSVCVFVKLSVALFLFFHVYFLFVPIQVCSFLLLGAFTVSTKYGVFAFWSMDLMRKCVCLFAEGDALS